MARSKDGIQCPLYLLPQGDVCYNFAMIPPDLFESKTFQSLTHAARLFYVLIAVHATTENQRSCLYRTLQEYNDLVGLGEDGTKLSDVDIRLMAWGNKRTHTFSELFVIPEKQLLQYGYTSSRAWKLKKELIEKGFIEVKYFGKGLKQKAFDKNVTVYKFTDSWKTFSSVQ